MKVLIVDDEAYIGEYILHLIDWQRYGFDEVMKTVDPNQAKQDLVKGALDLLITDIRMPEVSGIDLLRLVHEHGLQTKVVFLSGYSEFEYAQQAIRFGLSDYLLKPVTAEDLESTLKSLYSETFSKSSQMVAHHDLYAILLAQLALFSTERYQTQSTQYIFVRFSENLVIPGEHYLKNNAGIVELQYASDIDQRSAPFQLNDRKFVRKVFYSFFGGGKPLPNQEEQSIRQIFLNLVNQQSSEVNFDQLWNNLSADAQLTFLINGLAFLYFYVDADVRDEISLFAINKKQERVIDMLRAFFKTSNRTASVNEVIINTNQYIQDNLDRDLSLEHLAARAYLNPAYFSTVYKQETGINVSTYIQAQRLNRAAKLLLDSQLKVSDIGQMIGYGHTQYFVKLFKARYGVTPNKYRRVHATQNIE